MKTVSDQLLFLTEEEAQWVLDKQDPGYKVKVDLVTGNAIVYNDKGEVAMEIEVVPSGE
ncbi:MAG: hypothetical protein ACRDFB_10580 [Rhabdochlamydiaceae bacterium]